MNKRHYLKTTGAWTLAAALGITALCGCDDSFIYDSEGDCSLSVRFRYDYNMKYADAFAHEVSAVTLYLLDNAGNVVWRKTERGAALAEEGYMMDVDVAPGAYTMLAWAGSEDYGSFTVDDATAVAGLRCSLNREHTAEGEAYTNTDLDRLFHSIDTIGPVEFTYKDRTVYTLPLLKNTNVFRIVLQQVTGGDVDVSKFEFTITDDNALMDWDNTLIPGGDVTYHAWHTDQGSAEVYTDGTLENGPSEVKTRATYSAAIAELTTARLVKGNTPRLTVTNKETDKVVFSIPVIDYALLVKGFYNQGMDDQEFLDRQDEWDMVFFLDEGDRWVDTYIYINSWKIVLQSTGL